MDLYEYVKPYKPYNGWYGVVWCGVVWCGVVWCGVVCCGVVWCGEVWCGVVWYRMVWCGMHAHQTLCSVVLCIHACTCIRTGVIMLTIFEHVRAVMSIWYIHFRMHLFLLQEGIVAHVHICVHIDYAICNSTCMQ